MASPTKIGRLLDDDTFNVVSDSAIIRELVRMSSSLRTMLGNLRGDSAIAARLFDFCTT